MGKQSFRGYLISRFYPTREIRENLMHAKNMFYFYSSTMLPVIDAELRRVFKRAVCKWSDSAWCLTVLYSKAVTVVDSKMEEEREFGTNKKTNGPGAAVEPTTGQTVSAKQRSYSSSQQAATWRVKTGLLIFHVVYKVFAVILFNVPRRIYRRNG